MQDNPPPSKANSLDALLPDLPPGAEAQLGAEIGSLLANAEQGALNLLAALHGSAGRFGIKFSDSEPPEWVKRLAVRALDQVFPGFGKMLKTDDPFDNGQFFGTVFRLLSSFGESSESSEEEIRTRKGFAAALLPLMPALVAQVCAADSPDKFAFLHGFGVGCSKDPLAKFKGAKTLDFGSPRLVFYFVLLLLWPKVEEFKNSAELYNRLGKTQLSGLGDLDTFQRLCRQIGLYKGRAGRPRTKIGRTFRKQPPN
jgi:hypothetical protein